jgi:hypothetical protein
MLRVLSCQAALGELAGLRANYEKVVAEAGAMRKRLEDGGGGDIALQAARTRIAAIAEVGDIDDDHVGVVVMVVVVVVLLLMMRMTTTRMTTTRMMMMTQHLACSRSLCWRASWTGRHGSVRSSRRTCESRSQVSPARFSSGIRHTVEIRYSAWTMYTKPSHSGARIATPVCICAQEVQENLPKMVGSESNQVLLTRWRSTRTNL